MRPRTGEPARADEHGQRALEHCHRARGPPDRREAVPRDLCTARARAGGGREAAMRPLPIAPAWRLAEHDPELRWLVTHLWSQDAVGIVGGEPKCCKSLLALDLAVAVAAGVPCLRRFVVPTPRPVLPYAAADAHPIAPPRLGGIPAAA